MSKAVGSSSKVGKTRANALESAKNSGFENHVRVAVETVRCCLADLLSSVGAPVNQPRSMAKQLGMDKTLAWKLSRIVNEENLAALVTHFPGRAGLDIATRTLEDAGAPLESLRALRQAMEDFDHMVGLHCGDRETLELMLSYLHEDDDFAPREVAHRERAFLGNRAIWGVQARLQLCMHFMAPNVNDSTMLDTCTVSGLIDLQRLRPETVWPVAAFRHYNDDGSPIPPETWEPIDRSAVSADGLPILHDFSSQPLPALRVSHAKNGITSYEILEGPLGSAAGVTCLTGAIYRARFSRFRDAQNQFGEHLVTLSTPARCLLHELYVHKNVTQAIPPTYAVYSQLPNEPMYPTGGRDRGQLRLNEQLEDLGSAPKNIETAEFPRHDDLLEMVIHRMGWTVRDFHGFRCRIEYPPISARAVFRHTLPERP